MENHIGLKFQQYLEDEHIDLTPSHKKENLLNDFFCGAVSHMRFVRDPRLCDTATASVFDDYCFGQWFADEFMDYMESLRPTKLHRMPEIVFNAHKEAFLGGGRACNELIKNNLLNAAPPKERKFFEEIDIEFTVYFKGLAESAGEMVTAH